MSSTPVQIIHPSRPESPATPPPPPSPPPPHAPAAATVTAAGSDGSSNTTVAGVIKPIITPPSPKSARGLLRLLSDYFPILRRCPASPPSSSTTTTAGGSEAREDGKEEQEQGEPVYYLAYGSNLNSKIFIKRRGIKPLLAVPVHVPRLELVFDLPGIAYVEPCFANVRLIPSHPPPLAVGEGEGEETEKTALLAGEKKEADREGEGEGGGLYGVAYLVTPSDYAKILTTEGGGASYAEYIVSCIPLTTTTTTTTPQAKEIKARTLLAPPRKTRPNSDAQPSLRYLTLIRQGAREHNLPAHWQSYLARMKPYARTTMGQKIGCVFFIGLSAPVVLGVFGISRLLAGRDGMSPAWVVRVSDFVVGGVWAVYDGVFRKVFGDGEKCIHSSHQSESGSEPEEKDTEEVVLLVGETEFFEEQAAGSSSSSSSSSSKEKVKAEEMEAILNAGLADSATWEKV